MTIRELRIKQKLSQSAMAKRLGVATVTVSAMETGRMKVSPKIAAAVKEAFGAEVEASSAGAPAGKKQAVKKTAAPKADAPKARRRKPEIYIQSPLGGNIMPEEIAAKIPADADACYVRVDQNMIWWIRGDETGAEFIW